MGGMGSSTNMSSMMMAMMVPYLHFGPGDHLIFEAIKPSTGGAVAGAGIVLIVFAILERLVAASRRAQEVYWMRKASALKSLAASQAGIAGLAEKRFDSPVEGCDDRELRIIAPFNLKHDVIRGLYHALQALMLYALMLAVMTFQAAYIICIVAGLGIGEMLFGRIGRGVKTHASLGVLC
ncbi:hypothetical protein SERLA73DRAFT_62381 [Serpula lacrymans var. lacrymans S7.3]|uniref:Copper transport protein n=2 Tax=Serpula lacrymans var. lacrymans TaxID=341189 RepID=F8QAX0_SERL3|nr:uncharacterized protein SERLADRAFT_352301 [Serpula lacrymans var. lacrymans S7.9]EGN94356.1 hypothetical protein SERLA73DRAFT_62381 [Serpula lacrymans var. lacrymans S7.3]EGO19838.1 hypothetical protein SERLADRAFT_352301 [Serpula lacrymans var. lacrymans S7.9]